jgi:hypothetical protein
MYLSFMAIKATNYATTPSLWQHEAGHLLNLPHSGFINPSTVKYDEYGDLSTPMGIDGNGCLFSGPEMLQLGWATPPPDSYVSATSLQVGFKRTFKLSALADTPNMAIAVLSLPPAAAALSTTAWPSGLDSMLVMTYRVAKSMDQGLPKGFDQTTSLHTFRPEGGLHHLVAWLRTGVGFISHPLKLVVLQVSGTANEAEVLVCVYTSVPADCAGSFTDFGTLRGDQQEVAAAAARARFSGLSNDRLADRGHDLGLMPL